MSIITKKMTLICGHYGVGKTNLSINLAIECAREGKDVILVDLDIVNPYFRTSDYASILKENGVEVIGPTFANTNADTPSLPAEMGNVLADDSKWVIVDVGGDDAGATALGRFRSVIESRDYDMFYVINRYRSLTTEPDEAAEILREIEKACGLKATGVINNSHLKQLTDEDTVNGSVRFAETTCELLGVPLICTTAPKQVAITLNKNRNIHPLDVYVTTPWEEERENKCQE